MTKRPKTQEELYEDQILQNSIERVINTSINLITNNVSVETVKPDRREWLEELQDINLQDWEDLKQITVRLWEQERDRIFRKRQSDTESESDSTKDTEL
jgi:hypothetical protein